VTLGRLDQLTVKALMRALYVAMNHVLADEFSQMLLTQRDDAIETLLPDRANEALDESVGVGGRMHLIRTMSIDVSG